MVWTVNTPEEMIEVCIYCSLPTAQLLTDYQATRWGVDAILTDVTKEWLDLRSKLRGKHDDVYFSALN